MRNISLYLQDILAAMHAIEKFVEGIDFEEFKADDKTNYIRVLKIDEPLTRVIYILSGAVMPSISSPSLRTVLIASHNARRALLRAISSVTILHLL